MSGGWVFYFRQSGFIAGSQIDLGLAKCMRIIRSLGNCITMNLALSQQLKRIQSTIDHYCFKRGGRLTT